MVGTELLRSAVSVARWGGQRNFVVCSARLGKKKIEGSSSAGGSSSTPPSSSGGDVLTKVKDPPPTVFKKPQTDKLGPGASKEGEYKNPEYFSYHDMSYFDMDVVMKQYRLPQPSSIESQGARHAVDK